MKSMAMAVLALVVSVGAFAQTPDVPEDAPKNSKIRYESWCWGNRITSQNQDGEIETIWDCSEISQMSRCVENNFDMGKYIVVRATCE